MKWTAGLALGASFFLGACATSALGDETSSDENGHVTVHVERTTTHESTTPNGVVRMVIDEIHEDGDNTRMCVFVPAGSEDTTGALSCSGAEFQVVELDDGGNVFFSGDTVLSDGDLARMIEERLAEINDRLAETGELHFEFQDLHIQNEEFAREMEVLAHEMEEIRIEFTSEFQEDRNELMHEMEELAREMEELDREGVSADSEEMRELRVEMDQLARELDQTHSTIWIEHQDELAEMQSEMVVLRAEAMAELASEMARLREEGILVESTEGGRVILSEDGHTQFVMRPSSHWVSEDGNFTTIERTVGEDGEPRIVIRTTDPSRVEIIEVDENEIRDMPFSDED